MSLGITIATFTTVALVIALFFANFDFGEQDKQSK